MRLKILLLSILNICGLSFNQTSCVKQDLISNSTNLFTYKNKVYNTTGFEHPGGDANLKKVIGKDLDTFLNMTELEFHLDEDEFYESLDDMYCGELCP